MEGNPATYDVTTESYKEILKARLDEDGYRKLMRIDNPELQAFVAKYIDLCNPDKIFVSAGSPEDIEYIREAAIRNGEEIKLAMEGHTVHFDNYYDQARDREHTLILVSKGTDLGPKPVSYTHLTLPTKA